VEIRGQIERLRNRDAEDGVRDRWVDPDERRVRIAHEGTGPPAHPRDRAATYDPGDV
jgi:hypothetical protein